MATHTPHWQRDGSSETGQLPGDGGEGPGEDHDNIILLAALTTPWTVSRRDEWLVYNNYPGLEVWTMSRSGQQYSVGVLSAVAGDEMSN